MNLISELKRRNVFRVGVAYLALAWVVIEVTGMAVPALNLPESLNSIVFYLGLIGFPFAIFFAWAFELTPEGLMKTADVDASQSVTHSTGRKLDFVIIGLLGCAVLFLVWDNYLTSGDPVDASAPDLTVFAGPIDKSIVVLPFVHFSSDQELGWFADGLTEEILNALSRTPDLTVTSRTTSFRLKGSTEEIPVIAARLGVAHVLEGSVRGGADRIRVTAQLIRAADDVHLWSNTYDRAPDDIITIQEEIATAIARELETAIDPQALEAMMQMGTRSAEAYELYMKARALEEVASEIGEFDYDREAYAAYEKARRIDPGFAEAHARAADFWFGQIVITSNTYNEEGTSYQERTDAFRARMARAVATAPDEPRRLTFEAAIAGSELRVRDQIRLLRQRIALDPNDVDTWQTLTRALTLMNEREQAEEAFHKGVALIGPDGEGNGDFVADPYRFGMPALALPIIDAILAHERVPFNWLYQSHRAALWAGKVALAADILKRIERLPESDFNPNLIRLRQACGEGRIKDAIPYYEAILGVADDSETATSVWLAAAIMGDQERMDAMVQPFDTPEQVFGLSSFAFYPFFDAGPYPTLKAILARERRRPYPLAAIPFACKSLAAPGDD